MDSASGSGHVGWSRMEVSVPTTFPQTKQGAEVASVWTQLLIWEKKATLSCLFMNETTRKAKRTPEKKSWDRPTITLSPTQPRGR